MKQSAIHLIFTVALIALFVANATDSVGHHDAGGALLMGIAIGLLIGDLLISIVRWRS